MKKFSFLPLIVALFVLSLLGMDTFAQSGCGTPPEKSEWLIQYQQNPASYPKSNNVLHAPITVHLVGTTSGTGYFKLRDLFEIICLLNQDFEASEIQFFLAGVNYINNTAYYNHESFGPGADMMEQHNVSGTINCYIVESPAGNCGYYNGWGVAMAKNCMQPGDHTWAHEIGHYLSLPHPFLGWQSVEDPDYSSPAPQFLGFGNPVEKVDGSNCHVAADGFCDTAPDYLADRWTCNGNSVSIIEQTDPNGEVFQSDGTLFMSYANDECSNRFSDEQIAAMRANLLDDRPYLLSNQNPGLPIADPTVTFTSPLEGEQLTTNTDILLEWEPVEGATGYVVHVNPLPSFGGTIFHRYLTDEPFFVIPDELIENRTYYWQIRPYNAVHTCADYSETRTFVTGAAVTSSREIKELTRFDLAPNPAGNGQSVQLLLNANASFKAALNVFDVTGKVLSSTLHEIATGENQLLVPTANLGAGVYLIGLESGEGRKFERLVVGH